MKRELLGFNAACLFVCVALSAAVAGASGTSGHVVIILDGSGSMNDSMRGNVLKMDAAKDALKQVLKQIKPGTEVGMLVFSDRTSREPWLYPLGELELDTLNEAIDGVRAGGGTPLGAYIKLGADALIETRKKQFGYGAYRLLIVTDGEASDMDDMVRYASEVPLRGITMDVIGVKMDQAPALSTLAHSYRKADDPESLARAIEDVFAEVNAGPADDTAENDFELLEALPFEVAESMLAGLSTTSDAPLGAKNTGAPGQASRRETQSLSTSAPSGQPAPSSGRSKFRGVGAVVFAILAILVVLSGKSKRRRRR